MFTGTYYHTLETTGRVSVPAAFREQLGVSIVITRGLDGCLFLYTTQQWEAFTQQLQDSLVTKKTHRDFVRLMTNEAMKLEIDAQGRILLPEALRTKLNAAKDVVFAGSLDRIELWEKMAYHTYMTELEKNAESIAEHYEPAKNQEAHV